MRKLQTIRGISLIEVVIVIVIGGILASVAVRSLTTVGETARIEETKQEMEALALAIAGNSSLRNAGTRADFGYVGDVGAFPPNLDALYSAPGSFATWRGPYIANDFEQATGDYKTDAWGAVYVYDGSLTVTSTGSGTSIVKQIPGSSADYLSNPVTGVILDSDGTPPGSIEADSVTVTIAYADGAGGFAQSTVNPDAGGFFSIGGIPVGNHRLVVVYSVLADTVSRFVSISPGSEAFGEYRLSSDAWPVATAGPCAGPGTFTLRPDGPGSSTELDSEGCATNYECVDETSADEDITRLVREDNSYATDTYSMDDPSPSSCTITGVTVYARAYRVHLQGSIRLVVRTAGTHYEGIEQALTSSYADYAETWAVNPSTGSAWTWLDIRNMEAGISLSGQAPPWGAYCTQVWIEVTYDY